MNYKEFPIAMGTASGTFLSSFAAMNVEDIFISTFLAILGAVISFMMSCILNLYVKPKLRQFRKKDKERKKQF